MVIIIDNGLFSHTLKQQVLELKKQVTIINCQEINLEEIEQYQPELIIISNGVEKKDYISNSIKVAQRFSWRVPILSIGIGAVALAILFNGKVIDSKISNLTVFKVNHDNRTVFKEVDSEFQATLWCKYTINDEMIKNTDLEISAQYNNEVVAFRHKNLAIEGLLFDITALKCTSGKQLLQNFITYYL